MTARLRLLVISPLVLIVLIVSAACPLVTRAEEAAPPPPRTQVIATEADPPLDPAEPGATEEVAPTEAADLPPARRCRNRTQRRPVPVEAAPENLAAAIPEGTDVVVLDENGNALPLASTEAAEIIATGDPMWCPDGVAPGGAGCTGGSVTISGGASDTGLANDMLFLAQDNCQGSTPAAWCGGAGTIYIAADYDTDNEIWWPSLDIDDYEVAIRRYYFGDLTIQGGWDFSQDPEHQPTGNVHLQQAVQGRLDGRCFAERPDLRRDQYGGRVALTVKTTGDLSARLRPGAG